MARQERRGEGAERKEIREKVVRKGGKERERKRWRQSIGKARLCNTLLIQSQSIS